MDSSAKNLNALDSLKIISEMIEQAKGNVQRDSFYFLFWGWVIIVINLGIYSLIKFTTVANPYMLWLLTLPAWIFTIIYGWRRKKNATTRGHLDYISMWLWIPFSISVVLLGIFCSKINYQMNGVVLIATAMPTMASGALIKFKPLMIGGILFWVFGSLCFLVSYEIQLLLASAGIFTGYLVPGYLLKRI